MKKKTSHLPNAHPRDELRRVVGLPSQVPRLLPVLDGHVQANLSQARRADGGMGGGQHVDTRDRKGSQY